VEVVHARCAGLDISKRDAKVCVRVAGAGRRKTVETVTTWGSMTSQILALREHLIAERITCAVMEATGDYWKPFYYLLEDAGFDVLLVNARHVKNLPGRKTDVSDATRLAQLDAHGLVRGAFVPPEPIPQLRDLSGRAGSTIAMKLQSTIDRGAAKEGTDLLDIIRLALDRHAGPIARSQLSQADEQLRTAIRWHVDWCFQQHAEIADPCPEDSRGRGHTNR
jgi:transposase